MFSRPAFLAPSNHAPLAVLTTLLILVGFAPSALAATSLIDQAPKGHDTVVAVDFSELRGSPLYEQGLQMLAGHPAGGVMIRQLRDDFGIDVGEDLDALVMLSDSPPLTTSMLDEPTDAVEVAATRQSGGALMLVRGDLDVDSILRRFARADDDEELSTYIRHDGAELQRLDDQTLAIAVGAPDYLDEARRKMASDRSGPGSTFEQALDRLGTSQGMYLMTRPSIEDPDELRDEVGAIASFAGLAVDLGNQVRLTGLVRVDDEDEATTMVSEIDEVREQTGANPMVQLFGFGPLIENLSIQQDGTEILVRTSMTNAEATYLVGQVGAILEAGHDLQEPLEGRDLDADGDQESDEGQDDAPSRDGIDADFN